MHRRTPGTCLRGGPVLAVTASAIHLKHLPGPRHMLWTPMTSPRFWLIHIERHRAVKTNYFQLAILAAAACLLPTALMSQVHAAGPGVHGRVLGHDPQGRLLGVVPGAQIEFQNGSQTTVGTAVADQAGYYRIDLPPGDYRYRIQAAGYRTEDAGRGLRLTNSQGYAVFNLAMTQGTDEPDRQPPVPPVVTQGKLQGRVLEQLPDGTTGIGRARTTLRRQGTSELRTVISRATAAGDRQIGDYEVVLPVGTYEAAVVADGFDSLQDPEPIEVTEGQDTTRDFLLQRPQPEEASGQGVHGVVTLTDTAPQTTPPPIQLLVFALDGDSAVPVAVSDSGEFSQDLPPGRYRLTATADGYPQTSSPPVYVFAGRYTEVRLVLQAKPIPQPEISLEVLVLGKSTATAKARPLVGAGVSLLKTDADVSTAVDTETDTTGHAVFLPRSAGTYRVQAHATGFEPASSEITMAAGEHKSVTLELSAAAAPATQFTIDVTVTDAITKKPLAGAKLLARHADDTVAASTRGTTDAAGRSRLIVTRTGQYTLLGQAAGYQPEGVRLSVMANQLSYSASLQLKPVSQPVQPDDQQPPETDTQPATSLRVAGFVAWREPTGQLRGVKGARLVWEQISPGQPRTTRIATTGDSGKYEIRVPRGLQQVRVEPPAGFGILSEKVDVTEDGQQKSFVVVRTTVEPPDDTQQPVTVRGLVIAQSASGRETGVNGAEILLSGSAGSATARSGSDGRFQMRVAPGAARVLVRAQGFEPLETSVSVVSDMPVLRLVLKRSISPPADFRFSLTVVEKALRQGRSLTRAIAGVDVSIQGTGQQVQHGVTNSSGQFAARLRPGIYTVRATRKGYESGSAQIQITSRDVTQQLELKPTEQPPQTTSFALTIRVVEHLEPSGKTKPLSQPKPINGAAVSVLKGSQVVASGTTSGQGQLVVRLPAGSYSVKATATGFGSGGQTVTLSRQDAAVTIALTRRLRPEQTIPPLKIRGKVPLTPLGGLK